MKPLNFSELNLQTKALAAAAVLMAAAVLAYASLSAFSFSYSKIAVLAVAIFVSILVNRYAARIPRTRIVFSPKEIFAFWGIIWLGVPGGLLIAASASFARYVRIGDLKKTRVFEISIDILATLVAAVTYYVSSGIFQDIGGRFGADDARAAAGGAVAAVCLMVLTHYVIAASSLYLADRLSGHADYPQLVSQRFIVPAAAYSIILCLTIILYFAFNQFGIEFGLVLAPLAIIGEVLYRIHVRRLSQKTKEICDASRIHLATVEALATAIDARDQVGMGHVRRTQIYAIGIGELLGLPESDINALRTGALLHDIGKLAVPDHILSKPGRLTPAEHEKTKIHASVGASILEKVGFDYPVVPTVKYHHECWDGSGYPEGLKGDNIPLTARILSVADAYDTLRGARPYRPPVSRAEATDFLRREAGTQFDPAIVSIFLKNRSHFETQIDENGLSYKLDTEPKHAVRIPAGIGEQSYVEQIKRANREVFTLYELARDFSSSLNLEETLSLFARRISEFVPFSTFSVYLLNNSKDSASAAYTQGLHAENLKNAKAVVGKGVTGYVLKKRTAAQNVDPALDFAESLPELADEYVSMVSIPLVADEELIGAVSLYSADLLKYEEEHLRLIETISRIASDAIRRSLQHAEAETYALTDPMTGLPNARSLQLQFEKEAARAGRGGTSFQVLMLDLDGFKQVNDTFGHKAGDKMLKEISRVIRGQLRDYDFLARYAGDEFVAIIPETNSDEVVELGRRIEAAVLGFELQIGKETAQVGVSIGWAGYPDHGENFDQMVIAADKAMYAIKSGRKQKERMVPADGTPEPPPAPGSDAEPSGHVPEAMLVSGEHLIVEVDETHIISSAVN